jgi:predicted helicase
MIDTYNDELRRVHRVGKGKEEQVDPFSRLHESTIKWVRKTKQSLRAGNVARYSDEQCRRVLYRPYCRRWHFFDRIFNEDLYGMPTVYPTDGSSTENRSIIVKTGSEVPFFALMTDSLSDLLPQGGSQVLPFYLYEEAGERRRENILDAILVEFRKRYGDGDPEGSKKTKIGKLDIFYYVYAILHHPDYRHKYKANLRRELPRIPYAPDFWAFAQAGLRLGQIHVEYEKQPVYELTLLENPEAKLSWRVERMRLSKDKTRLVYNEFLTLAGIPPEVFEYRLGHRSALEWVIDQYQVTTDKRSGITDDPNRPDDPQHIVRLIEQVVTVSLETVRIVRGLPPCEEGGPSAAEALATIASVAEAEEDESTAEELAEEPEPPPGKAKKPAKPVAATRETRSKATTAPPRASEPAKKTDKASKKRR